MRTAYHICIGRYVCLKHCWLLELSGRYAYRIPYLYRALCVFNPLLPRLFGQYITPDTGHFDILTGKTLALHFSYFPTKLFTFYHCKLCLS